MKYGKKIFYTHCRVYSIDRKIVKAEMVSPVKMHKTKIEKKTVKIK